MEKISNKVLLVGVLAIAIGFSGCKKYEDGPWFSLLTKKQRITGEWETKKLLNTDVFIITQYFIFTILLNTLPLPSVLDRYNYYILLGGCILIGRLISNNYRLGFMFLNLLFIVQLL